MWEWYAAVTRTIATMVPMHLPRAISLAGLRTEAETPWGGSPRDLLQGVAKIGARGVVLDVTAVGFRPRELDASARRDVIGVIRRLGMECCGLDAFIPPAHFNDRLHVDRAVGAAMQAIEMAAELTRHSGKAIPVCVEFPTDAGDDVIARLCDFSMKCGVVLADCSWPSRDRQPIPDWGVDPATIITSGANPIDVVIGSKRSIAVARMSDMASTGRCAPGAGKLDPLGYEVALVTAGYSASLILDVRGIARQDKVLVDWFGNR